MDKYKTLKEILETESQRIGSPDLTVEGIKAHLDTIIQIHGDIDKMYIKKFVGSTYRVPKKQKVIPTPLPVQVMDKECDPESFKQFKDLSRSKMSIDDLKYVFCNNPINDAMVRFYDMVDKDEFSVHFGTYNYNDENTQLFMTKNLVQGFKRQSDTVSKYIFGRVNIREIDGKFTIDVCVLIRGHDITLFNRAVEDGEYYQWRTMDMDSERDFITSCWSDGATVSIALL